LEVRVCADCAIYQQTQLGEFDVAQELLVERVKQLIAYFAE
jgi:hypothetical protein